MQSLNDKLWSTVFGYAAERTTALNTSGHCVAHYTSAETALNIIRKREIWLRNASVMNDHSEIEHGRSCLDGVLRTSSWTRLKAAFDGVYPGIGNALTAHYELTRTSCREDVFMTSLCEHDPENRLGKLSMWRAYGGPSGGVALVFEPHLVTKTTALNLSLNASPILYGEFEDVQREIDKFSARLESNLKILQRFPANTIVGYARAAIDFAMMSIKHPGFQEELEWRLLFLPNVYDPGLLASSAEPVRGVPQIVYKIPLSQTDAKRHDSLSHDLNSCLSHVIIGPCLYPETVRRAFEHELAAQGFQRPREMITVSEIPLRQWG